MTPEPYHQVRADMALALIADGRVPAEFCNEQDPNLPSRPSSLEHWAQTDASFAERLKAAKATGALVMLSRCIQIADDQAIRADQKRLMIDTRMKIAAIWNPAEGREVSKTETVTTVRNLTPLAQYVEQCVALLGMSRDQAAACYALETAATVQ